jgi:RimK family alpha-L-glutamate ligase
MKSLSTYLEEKHNPKEDVVKDLRVIVLTTNMSETSKESTDKTLFRTAKRIKEECEKKNIPFYALYCESGYISKDDDGNWMAFNRGDDKGFLIDKNNTVAIIRGSTTRFKSWMDMVSQLEKIGIFCINFRDSIEVCSDKYLTSLKLADAAIPTPKTKLIYSNDDDVDTLLKDFDRPFPVIVKTLSGSKGVGVIFIESKRALVSTLQLIWKINPEEELLIQEYIETDYDVRCIVLGGQIQATMRRDVIPGDFRSNYSLGGKVKLIKQTEEEIYICKESAKAVDGTWVAVDYIPAGKNKTPFVIEVNSSPGTEGIEAASGKNIISELLDYVEDKSNWRHKTQESGFLETIEIEGVGHIIGNFDTGNSARPILHADSYEIKNGKVLWKVENHKFTNKLIKMTKFERGALNAQVIERPVVSFNITFNGIKYEEVEFLLDDRTQKTTKALMNQGFIKTANLSINPARRFVLSIGHQDFDKYNKDHYNLVVKKGQSK